MKLKLIGCASKYHASLCEKCGYRNNKDECDKFSEDLKIYEQSKSEGEECDCYRLYGCITEKELHICMGCVPVNSIQCRKVKGTKVYVKGDKPDGK
jgi:hypothetical protein